MQLRSLKDHVSGRLRRSLIVLWCAVGAILLIACVNLSNLLLARAVARSKEFAVRGTLGAGRGRIVRQMLIESLVLSGASAIFGLALAWMLLAWLAHQGSIALPLLSTLAGRQPGAGLDRAGCSFRHSSFRARSRTEDCEREFAGGIEKYGPRSWAGTQE
jgi:FtsX-like permease family protein